MRTQKQNSKEPMRTLQKKNESTNFCCSSARYYKNSNCNDFFPTLTFPSRTSTNQYCSSARYYKNSNCNDFFPTLTFPSRTSTNQYCSSARYYNNGFFPPLLFPLAQRYLKNTHLQAILKKKGNFNYPPSLYFQTN